MTRGPASPAAAGPGGRRLPPRPRRRARRLFLALIGYFLLCGFADFRGGSTELLIALAIIFLPAALFVLVCVILPLGGLGYALAARKTRPGCSAVVTVISLILLGLAATVGLYLWTESRLPGLNARFYASADEARADGELVSRVRLRPAAFTCDGVAYRLEEGWSERVRRYQNRVLYPAKTYPGRMRVVLVFAYDGAGAYPGPVLLAEPDSPASWVNTPVYRGPVGDRQSTRPNPERVPVTPGRTISYFELPAGITLPFTAELIGPDQDTTSAAAARFTIEATPE